MENEFEHEANQWAAIEKMVKECHREVHAPHLNPHAEALGVFKQEHGDKTHDWAHYHTYA